jgi:hypothetical protein
MHGQVDQQCTAGTVCLQIVDLLEQAMGALQAGEEAEGATSLLEDPGEWGGRSIHTSSPTEFHKLHELIKHKIQTYLPTGDHVPV